MAMGKQRRHAKQASMWVATQDLPRSAAHPFYGRLNQILDKYDFDSYVEGLCQRFYAEDVGRPGLPPGRYFRLLLIGYFEGLDAERAIAWRAADSFALREFLGLVLPGTAPDHSTISRTRRLIDIVVGRRDTRRSRTLTSSRQSGCQPRSLASPRLESCLTAEASRRPPLHSGRVHRRVFEAADDAWRTKSEAATLLPVPPRSCVVSFSDSRRVKHSVEVTAESLFEAAALGLRLLREHTWVEPPGPATRLEIQISHPSVTHEVSVQQLQRWAESTAVTPDERIRKDRVRTMLG